VFRTNHFSGIFSPEQGKFLVQYLDSRTSAQFGDRWHTFAPMELLIPSLTALDEAMPALADALGNRRKVMLYGDLGAGKTTLVQAFCRWLGVEDTTSSPTFSLINEYGYRNTEGAPALVYHLDLYRLKNLDEALDIGIEEILYDPWYCFIEWPQVIEPLLPEDTAKIHLDILTETTRRLLIL
jgi:tRNA threonylcarbamoyladenosine biosynthesis protein TsaE